MENKEGFRIGGFFTMECWNAWNEDGSRHRNEKGQFARRLKWVSKFHNIITNEGLDHILNVILHGTTAIGTWYCALVETNTSPAAGLTYATPSFTESTAYDEATRPAYVEAAASSQSITNAASKAVFTISGTKTIYGAALVGGGSAPTTKGDAAGGGTLLCYGLASPSRSVVDNDIINLTYAIGAADDGV
jgi:hypothetical protein